MTKDSRVGMELQKSMGHIETRYQNYKCRETNDTLNVSGLGGK